MEPTSPAPRPRPAHLRNVEGVDVLDDRLVAMERRLTDLVSTLQKEVHTSLKDIGDKVQALQVASEIAAAQGQTKASQQTELDSQRKEALADIHARLGTVEKWQIAFQAEKSERDKRADANDALLRWLGGSLLLAFLVAAGGAAFTAWQQMQVQSQLIQALNQSALSVKPPQ